MITYHCVSATHLSVHKQSWTTWTLVVFFIHALRFIFFEYKMETESESSTLGDDSVFWLDSEILTQVSGSEEGEREDNFR